MDIQLSPHFALSEFTRSQEAARRGLPIVVAPGDPVYLNLQRLCLDVLEPLRKIAGPLHITSGYRPLWLNRLVGGADNSQHTLGLAADLVVPGMEPLAVCRAIEAAQLPFDQLIHEFGAWTHVSVSASGGPRRTQAMTAVHEARATVYLPGLHTLAEVAA
jgi:hypothetical protein